MYPRTAAFLSSAAGPPKLNTALVCHRARPSSVHRLIERARPSHHRVSAFVPPRPRPIRPTESTHSRFARPPRPRRTIERVRVLARASPPHRAHHHAPRASRDALARRARSSRERIRRPRASDDSHRTRRRRRRRRHRLASVRVASVEISSLARSSIVVVGRREVGRRRRVAPSRRRSTIELNRIDRAASARSVGRSVDRCSRRRKINRRVVDRFSYRSTRRRSFRIDVVDRRARAIARGTIARRDRIRDDDDAPRGADSPTRARDGEEKRQGGDERAERRAGGHADGVGATDDGARARGPLRKTPSRGRRRRRIANE